MAQPIYNPSGQIRETGKEVGSNIESTLNSFAQMRLERARQAENKIAEVTAIKDELGRLGGSYVQEEVDTLVKEMRDNIYKQSKKSGNYTVDTAAIGSYRDQIDKLKNIANNTQQLDQTYQDVEDFIKRNEGYFINEAGFRNEMLRNFTTKEWLEKRPEDLAAELMNKASSRLNYEKMIYDDLEFGTNTIGYTSFGGGGSNTVTSTVMERRKNPKTGNMEFMPKEPELTLAVEDKIKEMGLEGIDVDKDAIKKAVVNAAKNSFVSKEGDPYAKEKSEADRDYRLARANYYAGKGEDKDYTKLMVQDAFTFEAADYEFDVNAPMGIQWSGGNELQPKAMENVRSLLGKNFAIGSPDELMKNTYLDAKYSEVIEGLESGKRYIYVNGDFLPISTLEERELAIESVYSAVNRLGGGKNPKVSTEYYNTYYGKETPKTTSNSTENNVSSKEGKEQIDW